MANVTTLKQKTGLILFGITTFVVFLELALRLTGFLSLSWQEWKNTQSLENKHTYRILCLGDSMTALGGDYSYPRLLENILNQKTSQKQFSVINKGIPGNKSSSIVARLTQNLDRYNPDMVIVMMGANDEWDPVDYEDTTTLSIFSAIKSLRVYKLLHLVKLHLMAKANILDSHRLQRNPIHIPLMDEKLFDSPFKKGSNDTMPEAMMKQAIEADPTDEFAYTSMGKEYGMKGKYDEAMAMFRKAIAVNPKSSFAYYGLIWSLRHKGDLTTAIDVGEEAIKAIPENVWFYGSLASHYRIAGDHAKAQEYYRKAKVVAQRYDNPIIKNNYQVLKDMIMARGKKLVCMQYPMRSVAALKKTLIPHEGVVFIDNEGIFKDAVAQSDFLEYFKDLFGGDFGHCTQKGNTLLAENIAQVLVEEVFSKF